jgi:peptidyl-prolyl cis-trans isomerase SurA
MKSKFLSIVLATLVMVSIISTPLKAKANDPILLTVGNKQVTRSEFLRIYSKNNTNQAFDEKSLRDYMELFVNYKLKVLEAESKGLDTVKSFVQEYNGYREQLAKPYMRDTITEQNLMAEAYEHMKYEVHVIQLYLSCDENAKPEDTLKVYNKIIEYRKRALNGESLDSLSTHYSSDSRLQALKGDMGYMTAFQNNTKYAIEKVIYNTKVGSISMPIRTLYGYHIFKILDKRPSKGEVKIAHIMISPPDNRNAVDSSKSEIFNIYNRIKNGESFEELAKKYSADFRSGSNGGELEWFSVGMMVPEFERAAFSLKNKGDISEPMRTSFGWHILKKIDERPIPSYESVKERIRTKISKDERANLPAESIVEKAKIKYGFKQYPENLPAVITVLDSTFYIGTWNPDKAKDLNKTLFIIGDKKYTQHDFAVYLSSAKSKKKSSFNIIVNKTYKTYVFDETQKYYKSQLDVLFPDFHYLLMEYHDGILLFNLMEQDVWGKAMKDTTGLLTFYNNHKDLFKWNERVVSSIIKGKDKDKVNQAYALALKDKDNKLSKKDFLNNVCKSDTTCLNITEGLFEKGENTELDSIGWNLGISPVIEKGDNSFFFIKKGTHEPQPKTFQESKGLYIAEFQAELEQKLIDELRKKYAISVNEQVLKTIIKKEKP